MIIVDTSVLVDLLHGRRTAAVERLRRMEVSETPYSIPGICCQEILQGAKDSREWRTLLRYLETQRVIHPAKPWEHHVEAARIYYDCRRRGLTVRSSVDCHIAQQVLDEDGELLHDDDDFDAIRRVRPLRAFRG